VKSIRNKKDTVKKKNRAESEGDKDLLKKIGLSWGRFYQ
jgi:hypothetical protein